MRSTQFSEQEYEPRSNAAYRDRQKFYRNTRWSGDHCEGEVTLDGGKNWYKMSGSLNLMLIDYAIEEFPRSLARFWRIQDGLRGLGLEHYDWSGIRDSSDHAIAEMVKLAMEVLAMVPIPWVPCLQMADGRIFHPSCFREYSDDEFTRPPKFRRRPHWSCIKTEWTPGSTCHWCHSEREPGAGTTV